MGKGAIKKGFIKNVTTGTVKNFLFNPSSFSDDISVSFSEIGSGGGAKRKHQYIGGDNRKIDFELFLRSKDPAKVEDFKNYLEDFLPHKRFDSPPLMLFCFGTYIKKCMVLNVKRKWADFNKDLRVTEMVIKLSLKEVG